VVYALGDTICLAALLGLLAPGETAVTHDLHVSMLRAARLGDEVRFTGRVIRRGRAIAFMEAVVESGDQLLARITSTKSILGSAAESGLA
jgi:acyl-coenzyme A thioesterase PaaI-like protein